MESSSQLIEGIEECNSSESGWTMYLASSIHDDDDYSGHDNGNESDDSMLSDASSGPSHRNCLYKNGHVGNIMGHSKHEDYDEDDDKDEDYHYSWDKICNPKEKKREEVKRNDEKKGALHGERNVAIAYSISKRKKCVMEPRN